MPIISENVPKFPRLNDLVDPKTFELVNPPVAPTKRPTGLFADVLGGRAEVLFQDAQDHPEKYDPRLLPLLIQLLNGKKNANELTSDECSLLDRATLDFATYVPPRDEKATKVAKAPEVKTASPNPDDDDFELEESDVAPEGDGEPSPYWWLA